MTEFKKSTKKLISLALTFSLIICSMFGSYAATGADQYHLATGKNIAWNAPNKPISSIYGIQYDKIVYLNKLEAIAVAEGYRDSVFKSEFVKVLDYVQRTASYSGSYIAGKTLVAAATKLGCKRVTAVLSGVGGAIAIGFVVDDYLNLIRYIDLNAFKDAINQTQDEYFVQIKHGYSYSIGALGTQTIEHKIYAPWNSNTVVGLPNERGSWKTNINLSF